MHSLSLWSFLFALNESSYCLFTFVLVFNEIKDTFKMICVNFYGIETFNECALFLKKSFLTRLEYSYITSCVLLIKYYTQINV
jgi:hypothetical protein